MNTISYSLTLKSNLSFRKGGRLTLTVYSTNQVNGELHVSGRLEEDNQATIPNEGKSFSHPKPTFHINTVMYPSSIPSIKTGKKLIFTVTDVSKIDSKLYVSGDMREKINTSKFFFGNKQN